MYIIKKLIFFIKIFLKKKDQRELDQVLHRYNHKWEKNREILNNSDYNSWVIGKEEKGLHKIKNKIVYKKFLDRPYNLEKIIDVLDKEFHEFNSLTEFGSGIGQNLLFLKKNYPKKDFYGYEFSSSGVDISKLASKKFKLTVDYSNLDFVNDDKEKYIFPKTDISLTITALEQISKFEDSKKAIHNILENCKLGFIAIEPVVENYPNTLNGKLSKFYHYKHNYIKKFETALMEISKNNKINKKVLECSGNPLMYLSMYVIKKY